MKSLFAAITNLSVRFRWITILIVVVCLAGGVYSAVQMRQELLPPIDFPQVYILAIQPGASSADLRDLVAVPLEQAVVAIPGVIKDGLQSTSAAPVAFVSVAYEYGLNATTIQNQIQTAINNVAKAGVPQGLKTTADLNPAIVTQVLKRAPSMWAHFDSAQVLAMPPAVLDAALSVSPDFVSQLDPLTRDQLAAERLNQKLTGKAIVHAAVPLPGAWMVTDKTLPTIKTFSVNSLPVIIASVSSTSPDLSADQLRTLVNDQIVTPLTKQHTVPGVANVSVSGGQQIPADVAQAAASIVARTQAQAASSASNATSSNTSSGTPAATPVPAASTSTQNNSVTAPVVAAAPTTDANGIPLLPASWKTIFVVPLLNKVLHVPLNTAADLLKSKDVSGTVQTAAAALNALAAAHDGNAIRDLSVAVITYLQGHESGFVSNLSAGALAALSEDAYVALKGGSPAPVLADTWAPLLQESAFQNAPVPIQTVRDLLTLPDGAAGTINAIVADAPAQLQSLPIKIVDSLTPDAIAYLSAHESGFLNKLSPAVLRDMSPVTLKALPSGLIDGLSDAQLKTDLNAIIADPTKAAAAALNNESAANVVPDDPNAPKLPDSWPKFLSPSGIKAVKADDLLRHPSNQKTAAAFLNLLANFGSKVLLGDLTPDVMAYLEAHEPTFYDSLQPNALGMLSTTTLSKLPLNIAARAESGSQFTPTDDVTRVNGESSLILNITKDDTANTVEVADGVLSLFAKLKAANPQIAITVPFEQSSFIKDSISGVAREGVLGAIMAVLVILLFLNFSFRSTLVTAVSIPASVAIAFVLMYEVPRHIHPLLAQLPDGAVTTFLLRLFPDNITLNIMTLSGLTVAIGRVVDDSIVVLENIYRQIQTGMPRREAVLRGTRDVSLAIFAATVTTVVVFLPIGLSGGLIGEIFLPFGLAVTYALSASFVVAITIVPLLAFLFVQPPKTVESEHKEGRLQAIYRRVITPALNHRWAALGLALLSLVVGLYLFATRPTTFLPAFGQAQITAAVSLPPGTTLAQTDVYVQQFEGYLHTLVGKGVETYQANIGSSGGLSSFVGSGVSGNSAQVTIAPSSQDADTITALTLQIRTNAETVFGKSNVIVSKGSLTSQGFGGFSLVIGGPQAELTQINDTVIKALDNVPGLINVSSTLSQVAGAGTSYLRVAGQPAVQFSAELETQDTLGVTAKAIAAIKAMPGLPTDLSVSEGFQSQQQTQGFSQTFGSLGLAILIVYLVMVFTFGSLVHPFTILFSLPLAVVGAAAALAITNRVLGISALIGVLMLIGIVATNAIVLVDRVQANRKERHMPVREALIEAGRTRLRPILMTALATMIALLPLASGLSEGAIIASELGTVVIGGLFSSTILTLVIVPVVYSLLEQGQRAVLRRPAEKAETASVKASIGD